MRLKQALLLIPALALSASVASAAELNMPKQVSAGTNVNITTGGSGEATLILVGPSTVSGIRSSWASRSRCKVKKSVAQAGISWSLRVVATLLRPSL
jgi:hypothetical protein